MNAASTKRHERVAATREAIIAAAERLFAEQGVQAVSNRQISEAAGQGNNAAVGYHFGAKPDLVRAIVRKHMADMGPRRERRVAAAGDSSDLRVWVDCLVGPITEHFGTLGHPSWFARFAAQVQADPLLRPIVQEEALTSAALDRTVEGLRACLPHLPEAVVAQRFRMMQMLLVLTPASREAAMAEGEPVYGSTWHEAGDALIDAIVGLLRAPHTAPTEPPAEETEPVRRAP